MKSLNYPMAHTLYQIFKSIRVYHQKHETMTNNYPIRMLVNENRKQNEHRNLKIESPLT